MYAYLLGKREHIERIEGIGYVGQIQDENVRLSHVEVFEQNGVRFSNEGRTLEHFCAHFLNLGHVVAMGLTG